jgi:hypothetical protein
MEELENKIESITMMLNNVLEGFEVLDFETFDAIFPKLVAEMNKANKMRDNLKNEYDFEVLEKYDMELLKRAKQIEVKFDNILGVFSKEEKRLEKELSANFTRRKIANYIRY